MGGLSEALALTSHFIASLCARRHRGGLQTGERRPRQPPSLRQCNSWLVLATSGQGAYGPPTAQRIVQGTLPRSSNKSKSVLPHECSLVQRHPAKLVSPALPPCSLATDRKAGPKRARLARQTSPVLAARFTREVVLVTEPLCGSVCQGTLVREGPEETGRRLQEEPVALQRVTNLDVTLAHKA